MITSRTPFRISFFGGGTDYPAWYLEHGGQVLGTTIDKYCYLNIRYLPPFFNHRFRVVYSKIELCSTPEEIQHPSVRETLKYLNIKDGVEIHYGGDLPARTGIGSSSAFTVGLVNAVYALQGKMVTKDQLSGDAIQIEQKMIGEVVGSQDQTLTAFGGLNHITFHASGKRTVTPVRMSSERQDVFRKHLMLFFTGFSRTASEIAEKVVARMGQNEFALEKMQLYVGDALNILTSSGDLQDFGKLLHDYWLLKRSLGPAVTNAAIDNIYDASRRAGALGGKILGAGGGGFLLLFVPPSRQEGVKRSLSSLLHVPFSFENHGSSIIVYEPVEISRAA